MPHPQNKANFESFKTSDRQADIIIVSSIIGRNNSTLTIQSNNVIKTINIHSYTPLQQLDQTKTRPERATTSSNEQMTSL